MGWLGARRVAFALSVLILSMAVAMVLPMGIALGLGDRGATAYYRSILICIGLGGAGFFAFRSGREEMQRRDAFAVVGLGWVVVSLLGALPFYFSGVVPGFLDAWFETVSGFTTTGSTIITDLEVVPRSILFWRSMTQWLGGMGIIVLAMALLPALGVGGMQLYKAEMPGPEPDRLRPRIRDTAKVLWLVYVGITAAEVIMLMAGGLGWFDSVCHSFTTMATGGYSTKNASVGAFHSSYVEWVITAFMLLAGTNFALHYFALTGRPQRYVKDPEFRFYVRAIVVASLVVTVALLVAYGAGVAEQVRLATFQVVSMMTTTGYVTADFELWPPAAQVVLFGLMFFGGCAGSTAGSIKCVRIQLLLKRGYREMRHLVHPHAVTPIHLGTKPIANDVLRGVTSFLVVYLLVYCIAVVLVSIVGIDFETAMTSVAATLGNVGPGLGHVGPTETFAWMPGPAKVTLSVCMLLGRLELFTLLLLVTPVYWRR